MYASPAARRRLRHRRLLRDPPRLRHDRGRPRVHRRRPRARHPRHRRPRHEPHVVRPPVVPGGALAPPDSPKRDWYVWSDTDERYEDARIIFIDTETSNWTWDEEAGAYYWHRFFSHQPDLNYDNPEVQRGDARRPALLARPRARRLPPRRRALPLRARGHELREPRRDPRRSSSRCARRSTPSTPTACCSPRPTSGPRTSSSTSATATSATWPSTSRSCRGMFMALRREEADADLRDPRAHAATSPTTASGACSCATTTS